ncbi:MAG TPA: carbohydrate kinase family protein [Flavobacteriaceae bacterium]|nr:carbohydrate kinase family protein [Flavobacteriaceae bacterium]HPF10712.1 carbohydrate kinase family protein [Flavobacteriaceae bacterium]HQU21943.1 carbohydrate kinase family protein [Flavobacteriaceae bacterium]HQU66435.1 carbohydrate kinase family protein [Flavobacteriaceae bacterium]HRW43173.1 carbohydrate kinase family protein [Flavobacteriaceae bacterium]
MKKLKVAVLGPIPRDYIITHNNEVIQKYGCATHTAIAISNLLGTDGDIYPVTHIRKQDEAAIKELFGPYPNIHTDYISSEADQGDVIQLRFLDQNKRVETQTAFMKPIMPEDVAPLLDCEVFVCVPVTDFEVPLETLIYIKKHSNASIVFDAHGPTTALTVRGERVTKFWVDRDLWLPYIDVLKMNLEEANCSWFQKEYSLEDLKNNDEIDPEQLPLFAEYCLKQGLRSLYVTLDSRGVMVYTLKNDVLHQELVPSVPVSHVVDTTGCGDSFAGGIAFSLLKAPNDFIKAAQFGNAMGAQRTQGKTFEVFKSLPETLAILAQVYS